MNNSACNNWRCNQDKSMPEQRVKASTVLICSSWEPVRRRDHRLGLRYYVIRRKQKHSNTGRSLIGSLPLSNMGTRAARYGRYGGGRVGNDLTTHHTLRFLSGRFWMVAVMSCNQFLNWKTKSLWLFPFPAASWWWLAAASRWHMIKNLRYLKANVWQPFRFQMHPRSLQIMSHKGWNIRTNS